METAKCFCFFFFFPKDALSCEVPIWFWEQKFHLILLPLRQFFWLHYYTFVQHQQKISCSGIANSVLSKAKDQRILGDSAAKQHHLLKTYRLQGGKMTLASDTACLQQKEAAAIANVLGAVLKEYFLQNQQLLSHVPRIKTLTVPKIQTPAFALLLTGRMRGCQKSRSFLPRGRPSSLKNLLWPKATCSQGLVVVSAPFHHPTTSNRAERML